MNDRIMVGSKFAWEIVEGQTVFVIAHGFKDIAIFKPKAWRGTVQSPYIVWYSETSRGLLRVSGNVWKYQVTVETGKFDFRKS